ncbi:MAG TPA: hypothetical protein VJU87_11130, partial [Gemmatimonadaceae bacterium]|nr:hypothetical protein [Gemmatimonadaceae bacterium]
MSIRAAALTAMLLAARGAAAQTAAAHVAEGDSAVAAMNLPAALRHYEAAVALDSSDVDALWKAANAAADLGEFSDPPQRAALYARSEGLARRAVAANPSSTWAHFALAKALGRAALSKGTSERVKYASAVYNETDQALRLDSTNAGAWHVLGVWNAEIMRLNGLQRFAAKHLLGGHVFGEASWEHAQRDLERAVALEPGRITHHLDLAAVYADRGDRARARAEYATVLRLPATEYNDRFYKQEAERR